jgi:hypothetical protein
MIFYILWGVSTLLTLFIYRIHAKYLGITGSLFVAVLLALIALIPLVNVVISSLLLLMESDFSDNWNLQVAVRNGIKRILFIKKQ